MKELLFNEKLLFNEEELFNEEWKEIFNEEFPNEEEEESLEEEEEKYWFHWIKSLNEEILKENIKNRKEINFSNEFFNNENWNGIDRFPSLTLNK